jgi:capsular polysaccharide biosynthesis protein
VELNDALRRVFGQHRGLILWSVVLGVLVAALMHVGDPRTYTASTRFALDTEDPETQAESASIADTAKAIATSPLQVKLALRRARARRRDPVEIAERQVSIRALGSSGVLQMSVTDQDPRAAATISNALAERVISARLRVSSGQLRQVLSDLNQRIGTVNRKLAGVDTKIDAVSGGADPAVVSADPETTELLRDLLTRRDRLTQQRTVLESERVRALSTDALRPAPSVISPATIPRQADPSGRLPDMALGALLGLILGAGLAALVESLRPTLVGGEALARELDTPLIGTMTWSSEGDHIEDLVAVTGRLQLAARAMGVDSIGLVAARRGLDLDALAKRMNAVWFDSSVLTVLVGGPEEAGAEAEAPSSRTSHVRPFNAQQLALSDGGGTGLVLVSPPTLKKNELDSTIHLLRMSPAPLVGVITTAEEPHAIAR